MFKLNSLLVYVLFLVMGLSLFNIGLGITGRATSGVVNVTVVSMLEINFTVSDVNFGTGNLDIGVTNAIVDTLGNVVNGSWVPVNEGFVVENIGNNNISIQLSTGLNASSYLGGTNPAYQYNVTNNESGSCDEAAVVLGEWVDVNNSAPGTLVCNPLRSEDSEDSISIDVRLVIPSDSLLGDRTDTFTVIATAI